MNCWFSESVTDSFGFSRLAALHDGLGLLPGSCCPHHDDEEQRRPVYRQLIAAGQLGDGWAASSSAAPRRATSGTRKRRCPGSSVAITRRALDDIKRDIICISFDISEVVGWPEP
jgi:Peptidase family S51